jgi:radical SAM protein with 4Fe4S-binding SPASM domain
MRLCMRLCRLCVCLCRRRALIVKISMNPFKTPQDKIFPFILRQQVLPPAGVHHYLREDQHGKVRIHLRLDSDGHGTLMVNASRIYHFNPTAALMSYNYLEGCSAQDAVKSLQRQYRVPINQARQDYDTFILDLEKILHPDGSCPVCELDLETVAPFSNHPSAPYRMDLGITYRCNNECDHCYNGRSRQFPELSTRDWINILDRLWQIGVPHIIFTGGEPTLRNDLDELIRHAENNGQITGLNTNGRKLKDPSYVQQLVNAGLDHVQITLESHNPDIHDRMVARQGAWKETTAGIRNVLSSGLYVMTNTTMLQDNSPFMDQTLDFLAELGVPTIGLNALIYSGRGLDVGTGLTDSELPRLLDLAQQKTEQHNQRLIWYTPTDYCQFNPLDFGLGVKGCTAALYNMCIEPDGSVIPCQSYYQALGNILDDEWVSLWNHPLAIQLRERQNLPIRCESCDLLVECGGGCPLARQAHKVNPPSRSEPVFNAEKE